MRVHVFTKSTVMSCMEIALVHVNDSVSETTVVGSLQEMIISFFCHYHIVLIVVSIGVRSRV